MHRLTLSPSAFAVALLLVEQPMRVVVDDHTLGIEVGFEADTVYRALRELAALGALTFTRRNITTGTREVRRCGGHWIWTMAAAALTDEAASLAVTA